MKIILFIILFSCLTLLISGQNIQRVFWSPDQTGGMGCSGKVQLFLNASLGQYVATVTLNSSIQITEFSLLLDPNYSQRFTNLQTKLYQFNLYNLMIGLNPTTIGIVYSDSGVATSLFNFICNNDIPPYNPYNSSTSFKIDTITKQSYFQSPLFNSTKYMITSNTPLQCTCFSNGIKSADCMIDRVGVNGDFIVRMNQYFSLALFNQQCQLNVGNGPISNLQMEGVQSSGEFITVQAYPIPNIEYTPIINTFRQSAFVNISGLNGDIVMYNSGYYSTVPYTPLLGNRTYGFYHTSIPVSPFFTIRKQFNSTSNLFTLNYVPQPQPTFNISNIGVTYSTYAYVSLTYTFNIIGPSNVDGCIPVYTSLQIPFPIPYGIVSGDKRSYNFKPKFMSSLSINNNVYLGCQQQQLQRVPAASVTFNGTFGTDTVAPIIADQPTWRIISPDRLLLTLSVFENATSMLSVQLGDNVFYMTDADIQTRNANFGSKIYQKLIPITDLYIGSSPYRLVNISLIDQPLNKITFQFGTYYTPALAILPIPPIPYHLEISNIQVLFFKYSVMDLTKSSMDNMLTLRVEQSMIRPGYSPKLVFYFKARREPLSFKGYFDRQSQQYLFPFTLPAGLIECPNVNYSIIMPFELPFVALQSIPNSQSILQIINSYGDQLPPIVQDIKYILSGVNLTYLFTIKDDLNGFNYGIITIVSDVDWKPFVFNITINDLQSGDQLIGTYSLNIPLTEVSPVLNQTLGVGNIMLCDNLLFCSGMTPEYDINPLYAITRSPIQIYTQYNAVINQDKSGLSPPLDITPPIITVGNLPHILPYAMNRSYVAWFIVQDSESDVSTRHLPIFYLTYNHRSFSAECSNFTQISTGSYNLTCPFTIPLGFNSNYALVTFASIHGLTNKHLQVGSSQLGQIVSEPSTSPMLLDWVPFEIGYSGSITIIGSYLIDPVIINNATIQFDTGTTIIIPVISLTGVSFTIQLNQSITKPFKILVKTVNQVSNQLTVYPNQDYIPPLPTLPPVTCNSTTCSSHGICNSAGTCDCFDPFYGPDCSSQIVKPIPIFNNDTPTTTIGSQSELYSSLIGVVTIRELDVNDQQINIYSPSVWSLRVSSDNFTYKYTTKLSSTSDTTINVTISFYNSTTNITFAGDTITMKPSTLKYTIEMDSYQFASVANYIQVVMTASFENNDNHNKCGGSSLQASQDTSGLLWMKLKVFGKSLYCQFSQKALIDGRPTYITNKLIDNYHPPNQTTTSNQTFIGINVPYYANSMVLDPNFNVLIEGDTSSCSSSLTTPQIIGIVVGSVVAAFVVITGIVIVAKRRYYFRFKGGIELATRK